LRRTAVLALQRSYGNRHAADSILRRQSAQIARVDQHAHTQIPDAAHQLAIRNLLHPNIIAPPGAAPGARVPWDGASGHGDALSPAAQVARQTLRADLIAALDDHLNAVMPRMNATAGRRRLTGAASPGMSAFEGAGRAAKRVVDACFGSWNTAAAWTGSQ